MSTIPIEIALTADLAQGIRGFTNTSGVLRSDPPRIIRGDNTFEITMSDGGADASFAVGTIFTGRMKDPDNLNGTTFLASTDATGGSADFTGNVITLVMPTDNADMDTWLGAAQTPKEAIFEVQTTVAGEETGGPILKARVLIDPDADRGNEGTPSGTTPANFSDIRLETTHGFAVGEAIGHDGSNYFQAQADALSTTRAIGIVKGVPTTSSFRLTYAGPITGLSGLTPGALYYVDPDTPGAITATEPTADGDFSAPILLAISATEGIVLPWRPATWIYSAAGDISTAQDVAITGALTYPGQVSAFTDLSDTPAALAAQALKVLRVNAGSTAVEFTTQLFGDPVAALPTSPVAYNIYRLTAKDADAKAEAGLYINDGTSWFTIVQEETYDLGNLTGAISLANAGAGGDVIGQNYKGTTTGETTWTFPATAGQGGFTIRMTNGGAQTQNWPGDAEFPGGALSALTAAGVDLLVFDSADGTIYTGALAMEDVS